MTETLGSRSFERETGAPSRPERPFLLFRVGGELFALELTAADEVIEWPTVEPLPAMTGTMVGVFAARDQLIPVYSPERPLGVARAEARGVVLLLPWEGRRVGLALDDVEDVIMVDFARMQPPPGPAGADNVLLGVTHHGAALVGVVDVAALLRACTVAPTDRGGSP